MILGACGNVCPLRQRKLVCFALFSFDIYDRILMIPTIQKLDKLPRTESLSNAENNDPKSSTTPIRGNSFANRLMAAGVKSPGTPFPNSTDTNVNPLRGTKRHAAKNSNFSHGVSSALNSGIYESDETR